MEFYSIELVLENAQLVIAAVNQGIDAHLQAVTDSTFEWSTNNKLICKVAPKDLGVIIRRLLESDDDVIEASENLVHDIVGTLGIDEIWLCTKDRFYITLSENYFEEPEQFERLAYVLDLPYISVFDDAFWPNLFNELSAILN